MKIKRLRMVNWRAFRSSHEIELDVSPDAPVVIVYGNNMRGKTSILNAIRWCLYGYTIDRGQSKQIYLNMNNEAVDSGESHMSVTLEFEHEGSLFVLTRHAQASRRPRSDTDLTYKVTLQVDGMFEPEADINQRIGMILHKDISSFFLFDGELIADFEESLLSGDEQRKGYVREAIERILGLPALQIGKQDLEGLLRNAERKQVKELKIAQRHDEKVVRLEGAQAHMEALERDLAVLLRGEAELNAKREQLNELLRSANDVAADMRELDGYQERLKEIENEIQVEQRECRSILGKEWWLPLAPKVAALVGRISEEFDRAVSSISERRMLERRAEEVDISLKLELCGLCGQALSAPAGALLQQKLEEVSSRLSQTSSVIPDEDLAAIGRLRVLRAFENVASLQMIKEREARIAKLEIEQQKVKFRAERLRKRVRDHDRAEIAGAQRELEDTLALIGSSRSKIAQVREELRETSEERQRLAHEIQMLGGDRRSSYEVQAFSFLFQVFEGAIDAFRASLRKEVQDRANEIFSDITSEREFRGLDIDSGYGLSIADKDGRLVAIPSAGAQQIVAFSLIGGLNWAAVREGPVVIDTPLGRLDPEHRRRVLGFLPILASQVVLLVHPGEFERDRYLSVLKDRVGREYTIARDGAPQRSRIESGYVEPALYT